jgi:hypothetical protein
MRKEKPRRSWKGVNRQTNKKLVQTLRSAVSLWYSVSTLSTLLFSLAKDVSKEVNNNTMALPPSTANWHWKNKNVTRWGQSWFERELVTISVTGDKEGEVVSISSVSEVDGDIELGQRKSKYV